MRKSLVVAGAVLALVVVGAVPAAAHVSPTIEEAPAGGFAAFGLRVPHGCEGQSPQADTERVEVQIPDGIESVTPQQLPGWEATVDDGAGGLTVTWAGGPLAHDQFVEFGLSLQMPDTPGETARFPVIQTCVSGEEVAWVEEAVEGEEEPEHPAPAIAITEAGGDGHGGGTEDETAAAPVAEGDDDDGGSDALAVVALVVGALGLLAGGYALVTVRRAS